MDARPLRNEGIERARLQASRSGGYELLRSSSHLGYIPACADPYLVKDRIQNVIQAIS
jgi:hypothetical protein